MTGQSLEDRIRIQEFPFLLAWDKAKEEAKCKNWPVVYLIHGSIEKRPCPIYIGETSNFIGRVHQHLADEEKKRLYSVIKVIINNRYNKSAVLDVEQSLIRLFKSDPDFDVKNKNLGQSSHHDYYQRYTYVEELETLWNRLELSGKTYFEIASSDTYKFSPYTALTVEQSDVCFRAIESILEALENGKGGVQLISGAAGTGKTIVAIKMLSLLLEANSQPVDLSTDKMVSDADEDFDLKVKRRLLQFTRKHPIRVAYVVAMKSLQKTLRDVFKETLKDELKGNGLNVSQLVIGPTDVVKDRFDILIVDEAHRLQRRRNIGWMGPYDKCAKQLELDPKTSSTLDWILKQSCCQVLFYDAAQSIRPSDIPIDDFQITLSKVRRFDDLVLTTQMRCEGGASFIEYLDEIFQGIAHPKIVENYDFRLYEHFAPLHVAIQERDKDPCGKGYSRIVAGYAWDWISKGDHDAYDITIEEHSYRWNSEDKGWITSPNAAKEIGCVHTTQGFDLAYVGVIIGPDLRYDKVKKRILVDRNHVCDINQKKGVPTDSKGEEELRQFVINSYKVMLSRGIKGCYVYVVNDELRDYLKQYIPVAPSEIFT